MKLRIQPPIPPDVHPTYLGIDDTGAVLGKVWFKFGCAHITMDTGNIATGGGDYVHVCDVPAFISWLQAAYAARTESVEE